METALSIVSKNTGASEEEIKEVLSGMIVSAKKQHGAKATNSEIAVVSVVCAKYGLNPLVKECTAVVSNGKLQVVVMIDGWYKMVNRQETFDGVDFEDNFGTNNKIVSITCKMYLTNRSRPVCVTEYLEECNDIKSSVWKRWPVRMLRHKSYIQTARIAFGISEVIDNDEVDRIKSTSPQSKEVPSVLVDYEKVKLRMSQCKTFDDLDSLSVLIREEMESKGQWENAKGKCIALKSLQKDLINHLDREEVTDADFEAVVEPDLDNPREMSKANDNELPDVDFG
jgi:hypothetical protein